MTKSRVLCFHGFWGSPKDFDFLKSKFPHLESVDVTSFSQMTLKEWSTFFKEQYFNNGPVIMVGYSQGGRLILEGLRNLSLAQQSLVEKVVLISTGVIFPDFTKDEREKRWTHDQKWAQRFLSDPADQLQQDWNNQEVLKTSKSFEREKSLSPQERTALAQCLTNWSQAVQTETASVVEKCLTKILFLVGERDSKYVTLATNIKKSLPNLNTVIIKGSGHRVLLDAPSSLSVHI